MLVKNINAKKCKCLAWILWRNFPFSHPPLGPTWCPWSSDACFSRFHSWGATELKALKPLKVVGRTGRCREMMEEEAVWVQAGVQGWSRSERYGGVGCVGQGAGAEYQLVEMHLAAFWIFLICEEDQRFSRFMQRAEVNLCISVSFTPSQTQNALCTSVCRSWEWDVQTWGWMLYYLCWTVHFYSIQACSGWNINCSVKLLIYCQETVLLIYL